MFAEDEYVTLSALQHYAFCPRQCALIHTEREWAENTLTTFGKIEHERVDSAFGSTIRGVRIVRSVPLNSRQYGIRGLSDVVEYHPSADGELPVPVEYKHGRPAAHKADEIQLCAQALCLEELHQCHIPEGFLFYRAIRRRVSVMLSSELRVLTVQTIEATRQMLQSRSVPPAVRQPGCTACSLLDICLPTAWQNNASAYNDTMFGNLTEV